MKFRKQLAAVAAACLMATGGSASAAIVVNDWTFDFGAIGGAFAGYGQLSGIDVLNFTGLFHSVTSAPVLGGTDTTDFLINTGTANGAVGITSTGKILGATSAASGVELTASGQTIGSIIDITGTNYTTRNTSGVLNIYAGKPGGAPNGVNGTASASSTSASRGTGMGGPTDPTDPGSVLIATFSLINDGTGTVFSSLVATGATKADFKLTFGLPGVLLDNLGNPLPLGSLLALTDSQTNVDPNGNPPTTIGTFTIPLGPLGGTCGGSFTNVCGVENGNFRLATAPEPGSIALLGIALMGMAAVGRRTVGKGSVGRSPA